MALWYFSPLFRAEVNHILFIYVQNIMANHALVVSSLSSEKAD